jgi:hypothetical protein
MVAQLSRPVGRAVASSCHFVSDGPADVDEALVRPKESRDREVDP